MQDPPVIQTLRAVLAFLDHEHVDYMLLGGLAVRLLAIPRSWATRLGVTDRLERALRDAQRD